MISKKLKNKSTSKQVIVSHHTPTLHNQPEPLLESTVINAIACNLDSLILKYKPSYWIYGHSHRNKDDFKIGNTKMITNQFGYAQWGEQKTFDYEKIIEV